MIFRVFCSILVLGVLKCFVCVIPVLCGLVMNVLETCLVEPC
jgi:hypothetical protein